MKRIKWYAIPVTLFALFMTGIARGQDITVEQYIYNYKHIAVEKMNEYGIPASITLAQGILESGSGNSELARNANNHFGIKCHKGWTGKSYIMDDDERNECFRKYGSPEESFRDHSLFLTTRDRYAFLFDLDVTDYKSWAKGLKKAGYATNPRYPELLIRIIEENSLYQFDQPGKKVRTIAKADVQSSGEKDIPAPAFAISEAKVAYVTGSGRKVYKNNGIPFVYAQRGDDPREIAREFGIYTWQIFKYNEISRKVPLTAGQVIYLEKKKKRAEKGRERHILQPGESMYEVAQLYGIRLKNLYRLNDLSKDENPGEGSTIMLR